MLDPQWLLWMAITFSKLLFWDEIQLYSTISLTFPSLIKHEKLYSCKKFSWLEKKNECVAPCWKKTKISFCSRKSPLRAEFYKVCSGKMSRGSWKSRQFLMYFIKFQLIQVLDVLLRFAANSLVLKPGPILKCCLPQFAASNEHLKWIIRRMNTKNSTAPAAPGSDSRFGLWTPEVSSTLYDSVFRPSLKKEERRHLIENNKEWS